MLLNLLHSSRNRNCCLEIVPFLTHSSANFNKVVYFTNIIREYPTTLYFRVSLVTSFLQKYCTNKRKVYKSSSVIPRESILKHILGTFIVCLCLNENPTIQGPIHKLQTRLKQFQQFVAIIGYKLVTNRNKEAMPACY
jgi:hypothetical protein